MKLTDKKAKIVRLPATYMDCITVRFKHHRFFQGLRKTVISIATMAKNGLTQLLAASVEKVSLHSVQCPAAMCKATINSIPLFRNKGHTDYTASALGHLYLQSFANPLTSSR